MSLTMVDLLRQHPMRWLGHVARMDTGRIPKQTVFGELPGARPRHGPKKRWRDVIVGDLVSRHILLGEWYMLAQDRSTWREIYHASPPAAAVVKKFPCSCGRTFSRGSDLTHHSKFCSA